MSFDFTRAAIRVADFPVRAIRKIRGVKADYREFLFDDLVIALSGERPARVLEIGPKDGLDTRRLVNLSPNLITLAELPDKRSTVEQWLPHITGAKLEVLYGNVMYDEAFESLQPFDVVWCTGVLYHNPEQLRFIRQLFDLTRPGGRLVLESATARRPNTRNENCIELWFPPDEMASGRYHIATNVTHLPSRRAIEAWLTMVGFTDIQQSRCHSRVTLSLGRDRAAFLARRPIEPTTQTMYYQNVGDYPVGRAR
ncbi:MAG TPA: class I SAM-dependent methyltransferase [Pseudolabrys sp.]|nr:class I SAM-dependent methyltransferase [Pseudolabrys sp.]